MEKALLWQIPVSQAARRLFQCSMKILCKFQLWKVRFLVSVRTLISQQHPSERRGNTVWTPINVDKIRTVQGCIRPDVMATHPDALQSSRGIQHSSASIWTTWQYRLDTNQGSTRISFSFADIYMGRQLHPSGWHGYTVQTLSLIRQDVEKNCNCGRQGNTVRTRSLLWYLRAVAVQSFGR
jgi:hypothetical protein